MIEKTIIDHLSQELDVPVYMEIPANPPTAFVVIEKTGSGRRNQILSATFAIQSYSTTLYNAAALNESVKAVMLGSFVALDKVGKCELDTDYNFTNTANKQYRYQAVFDIVHY